MALRYVNTVLEFIASTPGGGGGGGTEGGGTASWATQTSDVLGIIIAVLLAVAVVGFIAVLAYSKKMAYAGNSGFSKNKTNSKILLALGLVIVFLLGSGAICMTHNQSIAQDNASDEISAPAKIQAVVDDTTGAITFDKSFLNNGTANDAKIHAVAVNLAEGVDDGGCTWTVQGFGGKTLYENKAGIDPVVFETPYDLASGANEPITIVTQNMDPEVAKELCDKSVLNLYFGYSIEEPPVPPVTTYTVSFDASEGGSAVPSDSFVVNEGTSVVLAADHSLTFTDGATKKKVEAKALADYEYEKWSMNGSDMKIDYPVEITANSTFKVFFTAIEPEVTTLNGVAQDIDGLPVAKAAVNMFDEEGNLVDSKTTDNQGNYTLAIPDTFSDIEKAIIQVKDGKNVAHDIIIYKPLEKPSPILVEAANLEPGAYVEGVLKDSSGAPISDALVTLSYMYVNEEGKIITEEFSGYTDVNGKYKILVKQGHEYLLCFNKAEDPEVHTTYNKTVVVEDADQKLSDTQVTTTTSVVTFDLGEGSVDHVPDGWTEATSNSNKYVKAFNNGSLCMAIEMEWLNAGIIAPSQKALVNIYYEKEDEILSKPTTLSAVFSENVSITGYAYDEGGKFVKGANVVFTDNNGKTYTAITDSDGFYDFKNEGVPVGTSGIIQITKDDQISPNWKINAGGGVYQVPDLYLGDKVGFQGYVAGSDKKPLKNTEIELVTYSEHNGQMVEEKYYSKTNNEGSFMLDVQTNHNYTINVPIPGTDPVVYMSEVKEVKETPEKIDIQLPKSTQTAVATINLDGGIVSKAVSGWTKTKNGTYTKTFAIGSSYEAITSAWSGANIKSPSEGQALTGWEPSGDVLKAPTTFKALWGTPGLSASGKVFDKDGMPKEGVAVVLSLNDGSKVKAASNEDGEYTLSPIPENSYGTITYYHDGEKLIGGNKDLSFTDEDVDLSDTMVEPSLLYSGKVIKESEVGIDGVEVTFTEWTWLNGYPYLETFKAKTDTNGEYKLNLKQKKNYSIDFFKAGTPDISYSSIDSVYYEQLTPKVTKINTAAPLQTYSVNLGNGGILPEDVPYGWVKESENVNVYIRKYNKNSDLSKPIQETWKYVPVVAPLGHKFMAIRQVTGSNYAFEAFYEKSFTISGKVIDTEGQPVESAVVEFINNQNNIIFQTTTNSSGAYSVEEINNFSSTVRAYTQNSISANLFIERVSESTKLEDLVVQPKTKVYGTVKDEAGSAIDHGTVNLVCIQEILSKETSSSYSTVIDINGYYSVYVPTNNTFSIDIRSNRNVSFAEEVQVFTMPVEFSYQFDSQNYYVYLHNLSYESECPAWWNWDSEMSCYKKLYDYNSNIAAVLKPWEGLEIVGTTPGTSFMGWSKTSGKVTEETEISAEWGFKASFSPNDSKLGNVTFEPADYSGLLPAKSRYQVADDGSNKIIVTYGSQTILTVTPQGISPYKCAGWTCNDQPVTTGDMDGDKVFVALFKEVKVTEYKLAVSGSGSWVDDNQSVVSSFKCVDSMPPKASQTLSYTGTDMKKHSITATPDRGFKFSKCDYSNGTYTATFVKDEVWIPMQVADADGNLINFYPAFSDPNEIGGYKFAYYDGKAYIEINEVQSMSDLGTVLGPLTNKTLYYQKIDSKALPLKAYALIVANWNDVFVQSDTSQAADYTETFKNKYLKTDICTAQIGKVISPGDFDNPYGSHWDFASVGGTMIPLLNDVDFFNKQNTGFINAYGSLWPGSALYPWGTYVSKANTSLYFRYDDSTWQERSWDTSSGVVLAKEFGGSTQNSANVMDVLESPFDALFNWLNVILKVD